MTSTSESILKPIWADRIGVWASALCILHCLLTPILISMSAVFVHLLPSEEPVHRSLAVLIALIGAIALAQGIRRHRKIRVFFLMSAGLGCIFLAAWFGDRLHGDWTEVGVTFMGSILMICAHRLNHTFCKGCACVRR